MLEITVSELVNSFSNLLKSKLDTSRLDVEVLICHALNWRRAKLYSHSDYLLSQQEQDNILTLINRRLHHEPVAYITGFQEFWSLPFKVSPATLIPRPETEHLVEEALNKIPQEQNIRVLDLGTGSGAIALSIASERPKARITAVDISEDALAIAEENQHQLQLKNVTLLQSNWFEKLAPTEFDLVISNPPYVAESDPHLSQGDVAYEPSIALSSGSKGLDDIEKILSQVTPYLRPGGWIMLEHGYNQASNVQDLMQKFGFNKIETKKDVAGLDRITFAQK